MDSMILLALFLRVGVIKAQVAAAAVGLGEAEVYADRLGMPDMQVTIGLGRKAGHHLGDPACGEVLADNALQKITGGGIFHGF